MTAGVRLLQQFDTGKGDYTRDRDELLGDVTVEDLFAQIKEWRQSSKG